jgi:excisionase family DNA binding protein
MSAHVESSGNYNLTEAAKRLGVAPHTLRHWAIYQRRVPFSRLGRRLLFDPEDLSDFVRRNRVPAREEAGR